MTARVFISHRPGDVAGATALAGELDAMFGEGQVVRIAAGAASAERWREALGGQPGDTPILVALVTPEPGAGAAASPDDAVASGPVTLRAQIDAGLAAGILILPVLGDGVAGLAPDAELPATFRRLSHLRRQPLRQAAWPTDIAGLAETLRGLGVRPLATTLPGTMPLPLSPPRDEGPITTPMTSEAELPRVRPVDNGTRRGVVAGMAIAFLLAGGWGTWRWRQRRLPDLAGTWGTRIGPRGATTSREGGLMLVILTQRERTVGLSSIVNIGADPHWEAARAAWTQRTGDELKQLIYRGEGELVDEDDARWVRIPVQITAPGVSREAVDSGVLRGVIGRGGDSIQGRLWLESEQAERVVELRRRD